MDTDAYNQHTHDIYQNLTNSTFGRNNSDGPYDDTHLYSYKDIPECLRSPATHKDYTQIPAVTGVIVAVYIAVILLAIFGNLLVIWTVWRNNHMHTVTNYYIVNLAISDLLVAGIVMPLKLLEYTADCSWNVFTSDGLCSVLYYLLPVFVFASVLTLVAISIERYYAIVYPLSAMKVNSKSRTRKIIACTWVIPVVVASPYVFCQSFAFTIESDYGSISRQICNDRFDEIDIALHSETGTFRKGYFLFLFVIVYLIPSLVILTTCIKIAVSLLQPIAVDNNVLGRKDTSRRHEENKRKVARMVIVIAITFIVSWSPLYIVSVVSQLQKNSFLRESNFIFTMLMTHFSGFVNSCLNPIIYTAMSQKFRRSFKDIIRRVFFCFPFRPFASYSDNRNSSMNRFTSTVRHTLSDTDGNQIVLNKTGGHHDEPYRAMSHKHSPQSSSSGGVDNDFKSFKESRKGSDKKVIKKYIFKSNGYSDKCKMMEDPNRPLITVADQSPIIELRSILKNRSVHVQDTDMSRDQEQEGYDLGICKTNVADRGLISSPVGGAQEHKGDPSYKSA